MSLKKQYLKSKPICRVTFTIAKEAAENAKAANLVGDFNKWDTSATPMQKLKNGKFTATIELGQGAEYQFRYVLDGTNWINDDAADKYVLVPEVGADNSVIVVEVLEE